MKKRQSQSCAQTYSYKVHKFVHKSLQFFQSIFAEKKSRLAFEVLNATYGSRILMVYTYSYRCFIPVLTFTLMIKSSFFVVSGALWLSKPQDGS